tara:strand:+ start:536 stop:1087 length:552 start_codon:yes stop_codon:yes gene_type:complete
MRMNKDKLKDIIRDELLKYFSEPSNKEDQIEEVGLCHKPSGPNGGTFTKCKSGSVYSLSKPAADKHGIDDDYIKRGVVSSKEKRKPPKVSAKFGVNSSTKGKGAGRQLHPSGKPRTAQRSVSKYPERYEEGEQRQHKEQKEIQIQRCRELGFRSAKEVINSFLQQQSRLAAAMDGEYPSKQKG